MSETSVPMDLASLSPEQLEVMKDGGDPTAMPVEEAVVEQPVAEEAPAPVAEEQRRGDPNKAISQLRSQLTDLTDLLQNPEKLAAYAQQNGYQLIPAGDGSNGNPFDAFDDDTGSALQQAIDAKMAPLLAKLQGMEAEKAKTEAHNRMLEMERQVPGATQRINEFDELMPHLADRYSPGDKYLLRNATRAENPQERLSYVQELLGKLDDGERNSILEPFVNERATSMIADKIRPGAPAKAATFSGAAPGKGNDVLPDINRLSTAEYAALPPEVRNRYLG